MHRFAWALSLPVLATGCLGSSYTIDHDELVRLARTPPDERGAHVMVSQDLSFDSPPPPAAESEPVRTDVELTVALAIAADAHHHPGPGRQVVEVARPTDGHRPTVTSDGSGGGEGSSEGSGDGGGDSDGGVDAALVVLMVAASAGIGVALAATEGARYDGWVGLGREHPVHLEGPNGEQLWVPLAGLDPGLADWAETAQVSDLEGPMVEMGRAPLDRQGLVFSFELGLAETATLDREGALGFGARTSFGFFPIQEVGLLFGLGAGVSDRVVEWRPHLELQLIPAVLADVLHLGVYGQAGWSAATEDAPDGPNRSLDGWFFGGGGLAQIDLTTRLALTLRGGVAALTDPGETQVAPELTLGLAIY